MEYPELYLDWMEYLHEKKIYGAWKNDLSLCAYASNAFSSSRRNIFGLSGKSNYIDGIINSFGVTNDKSLRNIITVIVRDLNWIADYYSSSKIDWVQIYQNFYTLRHPPTTLSRKLSRKLYRSNNKISSCYREKEEQPWYDKSYEKNKYSKKAWRK